MEQQQTYIKGFNDGYKLARYSPDLYEKLKESLNSEVEYDNGIIEGAAQWEKEKENDRLRQLEEMEKGSEQEQEEDLERE